MAESSPDPRALMDLLPQKERSTVANLFYEAVRRPTRDPWAVLDIVRNEIWDRRDRAMHWHDGARCAQLTNWLTITHDYEDEAYAFAAEAIRLEQLPLAERKKQRAMRSATAIQEVMASKPPTEKQLAYLRALGWSEPVDTMAEASNRIDVLRKAIDTLRTNR